MKILAAGFKGRFNSSKILLDRLDGVEKLYLENDKRKSCEQLHYATGKGKFDRIIIFGQKPLIKDKLSIELVAKRDLKMKCENCASEITTRFDYKEMVNALKVNGISYSFSKRAGNSYCNNIYYFALQEVERENPHISSLLVHVPVLKNFASLEKVAALLNVLISEELPL